VGRCPFATDDSIDARLTPEELLAIFGDHQIAIEQQPDYFDSVIPPDRRRYRSQPGGLPTTEMLWSPEGNGAIAARSLVELFGDELPVELAQHLLAGKPALIDVAPTLGCVCSGAAADVDAIHARARVAELEPPRASHPILDEAIVTETSLSLPATPRSPIDLVSPQASTKGAPAEQTTPNGSLHVSGDASGQTPRAPRREIETAPPGHPPHSGRRYSPAHGVARLTGGGLPTARDADGRQLPRTYVARRRLPTRLSRISTDVEAPLAPSTEQLRTPEPPALSGTEEPPTRAGPPTSGSAATTATETMPPIPSSPVELPSTIIATAAQVVETVAPRRAPPARRVDEERDSNARFAERAVALPVARLSDGRPREDTAPQHAGDRPVIQLLTLGLLISMIVLVSAAVGVLVGRWMTQR
jgi:hypothetical protein